ncbi:hypothetical protein FM106_32145 [Brachybacterium faecium]|nr:hypothetical protein FM106_32145 [Brachybacterium faecium]
MFASLFVCHYTLFLINTCIFKLHTLIFYKKTVYINIFLLYDLVNRDLRGNYLW